MTTFEKKNFPYLKWHQTVLDPLDPVDRISAKKFYVYLKTRLHPYIRFGVQTNRITQLSTAPCRMVSDITDVTLVCLLI